jgi:hypothetical protein
MNDVMATFPIPVVTPVLPSGHGATKHDAIGISLGVHHHDAPDGKSDDNTRKEGKAKRKKPLLF